VKVNVLEVHLPATPRRVRMESANLVGVPEVPAAANVAAVEGRLQAWLKDNPSAQIEHVVQTPVSLEGDGSTDHLLVTIFYRD